MVRPPYCGGSNPSRYFEGSLVIATAGQAGGGYPAMFRSPLCPGAPATFRKVLTTAITVRDTKRERQQYVTTQGIKCTRSSSCA
eukprot:1028755-Pleurochrysis_carterae.AAC.1